MKCIKKVLVRSYEEDENSFFNEEMGGQFEDLAFDVCLFSQPTETPNYDKPDCSIIKGLFPKKPLGFVISLQKTKGQPMLFLDLAQRLFSIFESS